jgi:arylsulfatase A-like enzyme
VARTPTIDELARHGTAFPRAVAPANWTVPSHMSLFTGVYPNVHGCRTFRRAPAPQETIASWLDRRGYDTGLFSENVHLTAGYGLEDGFTERYSRHIGMSDEQRTVTNQLASRAGFLYSKEMRRLIERVPPFIVPMNAFNHPAEVAFKREICGEHVVQRFDQWLERPGRDRPFFVFMNLVDVHEPYPPVENGHRLGWLARWYARTPRYYLLAVNGLQDVVPWDTLVGGYIQSIEAADRKIRRILEVLARHDEADRTMVIVTGDHGQSFGEGGNVYHGCGATDSITRVPLVVSSPREFSLPPVVDRWTSLCELPSWIKAVANGLAPYDDEGHAPFPFLASAPADSVVFCEGAPASDPNRSLKGIGLEQSWNHRLLAAYRGNEKFVLDFETGLIHRWTMDSDPDDRIPERFGDREAEGLRREVFGEYEQLDAELRGPQTAPVTEAELDRRLRSWGYD